MDLTPVKSSNVAALGYDPASQTLRVKFKTGGTFDYAGVSPLHHAQLSAGRVSVGAYIHQHIKPHHKAAKVD